MSTFYERDRYPQRHPQNDPAPPPFDAHAILGLTTDLAFDMATLGLFKKLKRGIKKVGKGIAKGTKKVGKGALKAGKMVVKAHVAVAKLSAKGLAKLGKAIAVAAATPIRLAAKPVIVRRARYLAYSRRRTKNPNPSEKREASTWFLQKLSSKGPLGKLGSLILKATGTGVSGDIDGCAATLGVAVAQQGMHNYDVALIMALREWHKKVHDEKSATATLGRGWWLPGGGHFRGGKYYPGGGWPIRPSGTLGPHRPNTASFMRGMVGGMYATWASRGGPVLVEGDFEAVLGFECGDESVMGFTGAEIAAVAASVATIIAGMAKLLNKPGEAPEDPTAGSEDAPAAEAPSESEEAPAPSDE